MQASVSDRVQIELRPLGKTITVPRGTPFQDVLFTYGVEFPCGGRGRCKGCRVKVLEGSLPITAEQRRMLSEQELADGWRLSCRVEAESNVCLDIAQWEAAILADNTAFEFQPGEGLGVAVDLGTTTVVAQLLDLRTGQVRAVRTALNPQARYGSDVMSRVQFALTDSGGQKLAELIRRKIGQLVGQLLTSARLEGAAIREVTIVGNTVMHHLLCGISVEPLSHVPFRPVDLKQQTFRASELGWQVEGDPSVKFLACVGGFVGSDILAGMLATRIAESEALIGLVDLGTNGEIVIGNRERIVCASTAAGPAFEGGRITMGMRAITGAITEVRIEEGRLHCHVMGDGAPRGICGSGLVDAVAAGLELGWIEPSGRIGGGRKALELAAPVTLIQRDIRELQLAKAAIAAGIRVLLKHWGGERRDLSRVYLAGAFGNYVKLSSARRIGLIDFPDKMVEPAGNTALLGAKLALFSSDDDQRKLARIQSITEHLSLGSHEEFEATFVEQMAFPSGGGGSEDENGSAGRQP